VKKKKATKPAPNSDWRDLSNKLIEIERELESKEENKYSIDVQPSLTESKSRARFNTWNQEDYNSCFNRTIKEKSIRLDTDKQDYYNGFKNYSLK